MARRNSTMTAVERTEWVILDDTGATLGTGLTLEDALHNADNRSDREKIAAARNALVRQLVAQHKAALA